MVNLTCLWMTVLFIKCAFSMGCSYNNNGNKMEIQNIFSLSRNLTEGVLYWYPCGDGCIGSECGSVIIEYNSTYQILAYWSQTKALSYKTKLKTLSMTGKWKLRSVSPNCLKGVSCTVNFILLCDQDSKSSSITKIRQNSDYEFSIYASGPEFCCSNCSQPSLFGRTLIVLSVTFVYCTFIGFLSFFVKEGGKIRDVPEMNKDFLAKKKETPSEAAANITFQFLSYVCGIVYMAFFRETTGIGYREPVGVTYTVFYVFYSLQMSFLALRIIAQGCNPEAWELPPKALFFFAIPAQLVMGLLQIFLTKNHSNVAFWTVLFGMTSPFVKLPVFRWKLYIVVPFTLAYTVFLGLWPYLFFPFVPVFAFAIFMGCSFWFEESNKTPWVFFRDVTLVCYWAQLCTINTWILAIPERYRPVPYLFQSLVAFEIILGVGGVFVVHLVTPSLFKILLPVVEYILHEKNANQIASQQESEAAQKESEASPDKISDLEMKNVSVPNIKQKKIVKHNNEIFGDDNIFSNE